MKPLFCAFFILLSLLFLSSLSFTHTHHSTTRIYLLFHLFIMTYHHDKHKSPLRIWLPDNGQLITYQDEPISFRGTLSLKCRQARIKAVTVKLQGKMKVHWSQDGKYEAFFHHVTLNVLANSINNSFSHNTGVNFKDEKIVYEKKWDLMRTSTKHCVHVHGTQEW